MNNKNCDWIKTMPIARGGSYNDELPINSLGAISNAIDNKHPIGISVRISLDNKCVVYEEEIVGDRRLDQMSLDEIISIKLEDTEYTIPTLEQVLNQVSGRTPLLVNLPGDKKDFACEKLILNEFIKYEGDVAFCVDTINAVTYINKNYPNVLVGQCCVPSSISFNPIKVIKTIKKYKKTKLGKPDFLAFKLADLPNEKVKKLRKYGITIIGYTVLNSEDRKTGNINCDNYVYGRIV
ncbi:MAG: hypothetical protein RSA49_03785 [Anaerovoracaceae bacterium]